MLKVIHYEVDINYANAFLVYESTTGEAFLVDCGAYDDRIVEACKSKQLHVQSILITHSHYDHIGGLDDFKKALKAKVYAYNLEGSKKVVDGDFIPFSNKKIKVMTTPGHISDGISFYLAPFVFVGDAIFAGAVGGTADRAHFQEEIKHVEDKIFSLPDDTIIYPGHGAATTVAVERFYNPFFVS